MEYATILINYQYNMFMSKFTIIIPAFNAAKHIHIPLESLKTQTFQDFEVLIINDGSTDDTVEVASKIISNLPNYKIITKTNGNWGSVINHVIKNRLATGEYVTILDSDDYFANNCLEEVSKHSEDIIATNVFFLKDGKKKDQNIMFGKEGVKDINRIFTPVSTPHGKFYKNDLFNSLIELKEGVSYQDTVLYNHLASKAKSFYWIKKPLAVWWMDRLGNSTTVEWNEKRATVWLETCQRVIKNSSNDESISWALMYLWELGRNYNSYPPIKIKLDTSKAKFMWLPFGTRHLAKMYFMIKSKKFRD